MDNKMKKPRPIKELELIYEDGMDEEDAQDFIDCFGIIE